MTRWFRWLDFNFLFILVAILGRIFDSACERGDGMVKNLISIHGAWLLLFHEEDFFTRE